MYECVLVCIKWITRPTRLRLVSQWHRHSWVTLGFILALISQIPLLSLLQRDVGSNHKPLNASLSLASPCCLDFLVTLWTGGKNKPLHRALCSNVLATLVECEARIRTLFVGHVVLAFFCVDKFFLLPQWVVINDTGWRADENAFWVAMRRDRRPTPLTLLGDRKAPQPMRKHRDQ